MAVVLVSFCYILIQEPRIIFWFCFVIVSCFVSLDKDVLVLSDLFDVVSEFSLEVVWMVICFKLNALYRIKHRVLKLIKLFHVWWRSFRFESIRFLGRRVIGVSAEKKESLPMHTLNERWR